jgi:rhodanese-related sulfurtransferase
LRQFHRCPQRQPAQLLQQSSALPSPLLNRAAARSAKAYSTDAAAKPTKIWDFEAVRASAAVIHSLLRCASYFTSSPIETKCILTTPRLPQLQKLTSTPNPSITIIGTSNHHKHSSTQLTPPPTDVREPHELQTSGRIPHALNIPITSAPDSFHISADEFEDRFGFPRPDPHGEVVFYCRAGVRSRAAAGLAQDAGWTNGGEYPGSWLDWEGRGGEVER